MATIEELNAAIARKEKLAKIDELIGKSDPAIITAAEPSPQSDPVQLPEGFAKRIDDAYQEGDPKLASYLKSEAKRVSAAPDPEGVIEKIGRGIESTGNRIGFEVGRRYEKVKDAITGESQKTEEVMKYPDLGFPDESSQLYQDRQKPFNFDAASDKELEAAGVIPPRRYAQQIDAIYSFGGSDEERLKMLRSMGDVALVPDEKGNIITIFPNGYVAALNKPGPSKGDLREFGDKAAIYGAGALVGGRTLTGQALAAMGSQTAIEAGGYAYGGEFNPEEIAIAGILEGVGGGIGLGVAKAWGKLTGAQRRGIKTWKDLKGRIPDDEFNRLKELKEAEEALDAPGVTSEQFSVSERPWRREELDRVRKATMTTRDAEKLAKRFSDQDTFATGEIRRQVESIAPGEGVEVGVRKAKEASDKIFETLDNTRSAEANALYGAVRKNARLTDLRPVRQRVASMMSSDTIPRGEKEAVQQKVLSMMSKRNPDGSLRDAVTFDFDKAQQLKFEIDNLIRKRGETSIGKNAEKALLDIRDSLVDEIERSATGYKAANAAYSKRTESIDEMEKTLIGIIRNTDEPKLSRVMNLFNEKDASNVLQLKGYLDSVDPSAYASLYKGWINDTVSGIRDLEGSKNASQKIWNTMFSQPKVYSKMIRLAPSNNVRANLSFLRDYLKYAKEIRVGSGASPKGFVETGADVIRTKDVQGPVAAGIKAATQPFTKMRANALTEAILNPRWAEEMNGIRGMTPTKRMQEMENLLSRIGFALRSGTGGSDIGEPETQEGSLQQVIDNQSTQ